MNMPAERIADDINLQQLLAGIADAPALGMHGLQTDSRLLREGDVFLACAGASRHGMEFASQAIARGVSAIVFDSDTAVQPELDSSVPHIGVAGLQAHIGTLADRWYGAPSAALQVCGVTGTNGKTTVAFLLTQALNLLQQRCGYIGTLGSGIDELEYASGLTTPSCTELHRILAAFRCDHAEQTVMEVSSHALDQGRTDGIRFSSALFTNLSRDHIDYHGDMDSYFAAKAKLFFNSEPANRIVDVDTEYGAKLAAMCGDTVVRVSQDPTTDTATSAYVIARSVQVLPAGTRVVFSSSWGDGEFLMTLAGDFNVSNALLVFAELLRQGIALTEAVAVIGELRAPPGRLQRVVGDSTQALPQVYIDFAHTPDALQVALNALRTQGGGTLWCVFGCGGDRDRGKRPQMGAVVAAYADVAVVTSDNPRSEDPAAIIADTIAGMSGEPIAIEDRAAAIAFAISTAATNDIVLIAGKGHENQQIIGDQTLPFSDYQAADLNLRARAGLAGGER